MRLSVNVARKLVLVLAGLSLAVLQAVAMAATPVAVIRVAPVQETQADWQVVKEVLLADRPLQAQMVDSLMQMGKVMTENGLDGTRPMGVALFARDGRQVEAVGFVPTKDLYALGAASQPWISGIEEQDNGLVKFLLFGRRLYAALGTDWVYFSDRESALSDLPASPESWLDGFDPKWDVAVRVDVPHLLATMGPRLGAMVEQIRQRAEREAERQPLASAVVRHALSLAVPAAVQTKQIVIGYQLDNEAKKIRMAFRWEAQPGSDLAQYFASQQGLRTPLACLRQWDDTPFMMAWTHTFPVPAEEGLEKLGEALRAELKRFIDKKVHNSSDAQLVRSLFEEWLRLAAEWARQGRSDAVVSLVSKPDQLTLLTAKFVANSHAAEEFVGHLVQSAQHRFPQLFDRIEVLPNYDRFGEAEIHVMLVDWSDKLSPAQRALVGEKLEIAYTAANGYQGMAIGKNAVATLKRAISDCVAHGEQVTLPFEMRMAFEQLTSACAGLNPNSEKVRGILDYLKEAAGEEMVSGKVTTRDNVAEETWEVDLRVIRALEMAR